MAKGQSSRAGPSQPAAKPSAKADPKQKGYQPHAQLPRRAVKVDAGARNNRGTEGKKGKGKRAVVEDEADDEGQPQEQMSEKPKEKRRKVDAQADAGASGGESDGRAEPNQKEMASGPVRSFTRVVPRATVKRTWKKLSKSGEAVIKTSLDDAAMELLATLEGKHRGDVQAVLQELFDEADEVLADLLVPPTIGRKGTKGEAELLTSEELYERIALMESTLEPEQGEVRTLKLTLEREKKALEADEARLEDFESKRQKVEAAEAKESYKNLHPIVTGLLNSRKRDRPALALFERSTPSNAWITEAIMESAAESEPPTATAESEEEDEDEAGPYDPKKDDYLVTLSVALDASLGEVERRLEGLRRVDRIVDAAEQGLVGLH